MADNFSLNIPLEYLHRISDHCPRALGAYLLCWQTGETDITFTKEAAEKYCISWTRLKNDIRSLAKEGLLEYSQKGNILSITLAEYYAD